MNNSNIPLQFTYEPIDCRIFYATSTYNNFTALWQYAADAIWKTPSLCVPSPANSTASVILSGFETRRDLESRDWDEDYVGAATGATCNPSVPGSCGDMICVQSPRCRNNVLDPNAFQCQIPCDARTNQCPSRKGACFTPPQGACYFGSCKYCQDAIPLTRASCRATRTSTHNNGVPNGEMNIPDFAVKRQSTDE